jgi:outer membrane receptor protein involved in Fe transport
LATLAAFEGTGGISNTGLEPQKVTEYELGFRQRLTERSAFSVSGFFRQIDNLIQQRDIRGAYPSEFLFYQNVDFGTVKGMEFDFDLRRTNGVQVNANYTLSFAKGTGSASNTISTITWIDETPPNFISPLDFDQRHRLNVNIDYRLGQGEGPTIAGAKVFENFGVNVLATAGSGFPYTSQSDILGVIESRAPRPVGGINGERMPWQSRIDLRLDRRFLLGSGKSLSAFFWVQNLFDQENVNGVWRATGLADDDGYLATQGGLEFLENGVPATETLYRHRTRALGNMGIPRLMRLGVRLDF